MPPAPHPLPGHLGNEFSVAAARAAGASASRLRAKDLESPFHGVRVRRELRTTEPGAVAGDEAAPSPWELARRAEVQKAQAFSTVMTPRMFFAGRTAAILQGAWVDPGPRLVVGVFAPGRAPRAAGVRGLRVARELAHVRTHDGMRMTSPATTWAMLAAELTVRDLVSLGDSMVRVPRDDRGRAQPSRRLATITDLERAALAGRRVGIDKLRQALALVRVGSSSPLETELRLDAAAAGLPDAELDVEIRDRRGRLLGISELIYRDQRVAVEVEGDHHRVTRKQWNRDIDKYADYAAAGWEVVRLTSAHIRGDRARGVGLVEAALLRHGWRPARTPSGRQRLRGRDTP